MTNPGEGYGQQGQPGYGPGYGQQGQGEPGYAGPDGGAPGWGQPAMPPKPKNGMGTAALIFGILALLTCWWLPVVGGVLAILAIIFGVVGRGRVKRLEANNKGVATAGLVLGIITLILNIILSVLFFLGAALFFNLGGGNALQQAQDCVNAAQNQPNPAAVQQALQQCADQFGAQLPQLGGDQQNG
ncbi:hypothetical protein GCM10023200_08240 [Actinomycetospora chlora]|uniref:DUF4190 domain-containing protein n=1 Tax=Actinomycetospora chlora TaxID=663608 RepID=A0ABP9AC05_9PSEU